MGHWTVIYLDELALAFDSATHLTTYQRRESLNEPVNVSVTVIERDGRNPQNVRFAPVTDNSFCSKGIANDPALLCNSE